MVVRGRVVVTKSILDDRPRRVHPHVYLLVRATGRAAENGSRKATKLCGGPEEEAGGKVRPRGVREPQAKRLLGVEPRQRSFTRVTPARYGRPVATAPLDDLNDA